MNFTKNLVTFVLCILLSISTLAASCNIVTAGDSISPHDIHEDKDEK